MSTPAPTPTPKPTSVFAPTSTTAPAAEAATGDATHAPTREATHGPTGDATHAPELPDRIRAFIERPIVATIATTGPDGRPHQAVAWYRLDPDGTILVNSRAPRHWPDNLRRTGHASLAVIDPDDNLSWVGLACELVEVIDDVEQARDDIVALAHRYRDGNPSPQSIAEFRSQQRISFRLRPVRIHDHLEG